jgi:uncharacterized protein
MIIVSNSSPLILLAKMNMLHLLKELYKRIHIPQAVYNEVVVRGKEEGYSDASVIDKAINEIIIVKRLDAKHQKEAEKLNRIIGKGESESIMLAIQEKARYLLIDNLEPRKMAEAKHIVCRSTPGILLEARKKCILTHEGYVESIKSLAGNAWLSGDIVAHFLDAGYKIKEERK